MASCELMDTLLNQSTVHVWFCDLEIAEPQIASYAKLLSADELARAQRFHFNHDKRRFIVARAVLRALLSHYCQLSAKALDFNYAVHGKPSLQVQHNPNDLTFNIAHSHELSVYAFAQHHAIGIDVEYLLRKVDCLALAKRFFAAQEYQQLVALPADQQQRGFFNGWTRKEAFIKALGDGLFFSLDRFVVDLSSDQPAKIISIEGDKQKAQTWSLSAFTPQANYVGALASNMEIATIKYQRWNHDQFNR